MKALVLNPGATELELVDDIDVEAPRLGEVRVAVKWCGLCHSDVSQIDGVHPAMTPVILGHEASGIVTEVAEGVATLAVGDHVILSPQQACGRCYWCVRDEHSSCTNAGAIAMSMLPDGSTRLSRKGETVYRGLGLGAFAEEVVISESGAIKIPDDVPLDVACIIGCAVQTGVGAAINTAKVKPGSTVLVLGAGGIGISVVQGAAIAGATKIIVSDPIEDRRESAMKFGATHVIDPTNEDVQQAVMALTEVGVDYAFDAVGHGDLVETAYRSTRSGGTTVMVGAPPVDHSLALPIAEAMFTEKKLVGCLLGSSHAPRDFPMLVDLWQQGLLDLDSMVTKRRPMSEIADAIADMKDGRGMRTVLSISE